MFRKILIVLGLWLSLSLSPAVVAATPPSADDVFGLTVSRAADNGLLLKWSVRPGTYLYRDKIAARTADGQAIPVVTQAGDIKDDPTFGTVEVYHSETTAEIAAKDLPTPGTISVTYQGCAEAGICYPPVTKTIDTQTLSVSSAGFGLLAAAPAAAKSGAATSSVSMLPLTVWTPTTNQSHGAATGGSGTSELSGNLLVVLLSFFGVGLLLAFTPCVFPMIPILSGILAGSGKRLSAGRGLVLSTSYVVAVATAYALVGAASAWGGLNLQIALQTPLALGGLAALFGIFALSMYGLFDLELPGSWTSRLTRATNGKGGSVGVAALLGFVSALVVGPCMTPALAGALLYVAQTGDVLRGAAALFAMGLGLGVPLIVFGIFGGRFLPRAGIWLTYVKQASAFVFLGLAVWLLARIVPPPATLLLSGGVTILAGFWLVALALKRSGIRLLQLLPPIFGGGTVLAGLLLIGLGASPTLFAGLLPQNTTRAETFGGFTRTVTDIAGLKAALADAQTLSRPILVDFTADWCVTCHEIDAEVFGNPAIRARMANISLIRADLSTYSAKGQALMKRFGVAGPPTLFFLDPQDAKELTRTRVVGALSPKKFATMLDEAGA